MKTSDVWAVHETYQGTYLVARGTMERRWEYLTDYPDRESAEAAAAELARTQGGSLAPYVPLEKKP